MGSPKHQWFSGKIHRCHSSSVDVDGPRVRFAADAVEILFFCFECLQGGAQTTICFVYPGLFLLNPFTKVQSIVSTLRSSRLLQPLEILAHG